jgi:hypothetical protein
MAETRAEAKATARQKAAQESAQSPAQPAAPREPEAGAEQVESVDPEWTALQDRARAGGDDAAQAVLDAFERGVKAGVDRSEAVRSEGGKASITTEDVAALAGAPLGAARSRPRRVLLSEGVRQDLERLGKVTDPGTGYELEMDRDTGKVTAYERPAAPAAQAPQRRQVDVEIVGPGHEPQNQ